MKGYFTPGAPTTGGADAFNGTRPGTTVCYSNAGIGLLGALVEIVSGQSLPDFTRQNIFEKVGMTRTSWRIADYCDPGELAHGVRWSGDHFVPHDNGNFGQPEGHPEIASGMLRSTAIDLARFLLVMEADGALPNGGRILSVTSARKLKRRQLDPGLPACPGSGASAAEQGLVWMYIPAGDGDWFGHYGGVNGFLSSFSYRVRDGLSLVLLMNTLDLTADMQLETDVLTHL